MNRLHLRPSHIPVIAVLLFLAFSSAVYAQTTYLVSGILNVVPPGGPDALGLDQNLVTATATLTQTMAPISTMTTSSSSTNTYSGVGAGIQLQGIQCGLLTSPTVTLTDNVGAPDTITLSNCQIQYALVSATITLPDGNMITAAPATIPLTSITGTVTVTLGSLGQSVYTLSDATIYTCGDAMCDNSSIGDPAPVVTPSPTSWTPTATLGSTTPLSQTITFTTAPANDAVSFTTSASTADGGTWLTVSPSTNTSSTITITVNPTGLTQSSYSGSVLLTYGHGLTTSIPVSLTITGGTVTSALTGPPSMTFNYTPGGTAPASQLLNINGPTGTSVNAAVTSGNSWLSVSPGTGSTPAIFTVSVGTTGLTTGTLSGNIQITAANLSPLNIPVTYNVGSGSSTLTVPTTPLVFSYSVGGSAPAAQVVSVQGTSGITFSTSTGGTWLVATPSNATVPGSVSISVNPSGLAVGAYFGAVTVASTGAAGSPASIPVTLNVTAPAITASPSALSFNYQIGAAAPVAQPITIGGTSGTAFTATTATTSGGSWLSVSSSSGTAPGSINVSILTSSLTSAGTYNGSVTIASAGSPSQTVNVTLVVSSTPTITATPSTMSFAFQIGGSAPPAQPITIGGSSGLAFTATASTSGGGSWLVVNSGSGTAPGSVSVSVKTSLITTPGTYNGSVTIAANGALSQTVNVTLVAATTPTITPSPSSLNFTYSIDSSTPQAQTVNISGGSALAFIATVTSGAQWLSVTPGSGSTPGAISVSVNTSGLTSGTYNGAVTIASGGASNTPFSIPVTLTVSGSTPTISLSASSLNFTSTVGGAAPATQTVNVTSTATSTVSLGISGGTWLSATLSGSSTPAVVTVSANPSNLTAGTYSGTITVKSVGASNTPQTVAVQFVVSAATTISATPGNLSFAYALGGSNPPPQTINVTSSQPATIATSVAGASWLTVTSSSSSTPSTITATVNPASLPAGTYQAAISITSASASNSPQTLPVTLVVSSKPTLAPSPSSLTFTAPAGGASPAPQSISLSGSAPLAFTATASPSWLSVSSSASGTPATLAATVNIAGMTQGSYQGAITINSAAAANAPIIIPVILNLAVPLTAAGPSISSIVSAASYDTTGFSPGVIVSIFGKGLGPLTGAVFSVNSKGSLDTTLDGVTVTADGVPAIPLYVQDGQVNAILPFTLGTGGQANVEVTYNGQTSSQFNIPLAFSDVQIFTADASGSGPGSILNQDYSVNTATNPAAKGSIVSVYGTGAGSVSPNAVAGDVAGDALSLVSLPYAATVNGENATIQYAGTAPSLVYGVDQFNVQVPADAPTGSVKIVLKVGDSASQADVTVFVK